MWAAGPCVQMCFALIHAPAGSMVSFLGAHTFPALPQFPPPLHHRVGATVVTVPWRAVRSPARQFAHHQDTAPAPPPNPWVQLVCSTSPLTVTAGACTGVSGGHSGSHCGKPQWSPQGKNGGASLTSEETWAQRDHCTCPSIKVVEMEPNPDSWL